MSRLATHLRTVTTVLVAATALLLAAGDSSAHNYPPPSSSQRATAQQVAHNGVPLSALAPNAPDSYTVKRGDTLWDISKLFLTSPWRWPELWGMNLAQIRNPHLIYPGQLLVLEKSGGRARLVMGRSLGPQGDLRLSPRMRSSSLDTTPIASVPMDLLRAFLTRAVVLDANTLDAAPRLVAAGDERVLMEGGNTVYARGDVSAAQNWQVFRQPVALTDPGTGEVLGWEAAYVGNAERLAAGSGMQPAEEGSAIAPATLRLHGMREEAVAGDRLAPAQPMEFDAFAPHPVPAGTNAQVMSIYGGGEIAGQNHVVAINRGARDGIERGHMMALWRDGRTVHDSTSEDRAAIAIPPERTGTAFVFRVFDRVSYALVLRATDAARRGDRLTAP